MRAGPARAGTGNGGRTLKRLAVVTAAVLAASAALGPAPAAAFHTLDCPPGRTIVDGETGQRRCAAVVPEVQEQFLRSRQLQQEQERRRRALQLQQSQNERLQAQERRARELLLQQNQRELQQEIIARQELARQQQFQRALTEQSLQPAQENAQAVTELEVLKQLAPDEARRQAALRASELVLQQNLLRQQQALPTAELLDEIRNRRRRLLKQEE